MQAQRSSILGSILVILFLSAMAACQGAAIDVVPSPTEPGASTTLRAGSSPTPAPTRAQAASTPRSSQTPTSTLTPTQAPTATPTPLACLGQAGRSESGALRDERLPLPMEYSVYLPPCYDEEPEHRYPVLYLIHGQNYNQDQWDRLGADESAAALIASGELPPFLIVMPRDRSWAQPTEDMFGQVFSDSLVPHIDALYRTLPQREYRAVGGLSRGAGWAVHLGLSHWELFGAIGGHSLPVFWADTPHIRDWLDAIPEEQMPRIYLDIGDRDRPNILKSAIWFEELLTERDIPHEWHLFSGYHEEAYWQANVERYLRWYAAPW